MKTLAYVVGALGATYLLLGARQLSDRGVDADHLAAFAELALEAEAREASVLAGEAADVARAAEAEARREEAVMAAAARRAYEGVGGGSRLLEIAPAADEGDVAAPAFVAPPPKKAARARPPGLSDHDYWKAAGHPVQRPPDGDFVAENTVNGRWIPPPKPARPEPARPGDGCTWRSCFTDAKKAPCIHFCRESPLTAQDAPPDYVPDPAALRTKWLAKPTAQPKELCDDFGVSGGPDGDVNRRLLEEAPIKAARFEQRAGPRLLCLMYTMAEAHPKSLRAATETWAVGCDGFVAFSTASDPGLNAVSIEHAGVESYSNMWQKVRSIWRFVAAHYARDYDFFFIGGDDLYVLPQNLRDYLATRPGPDEPQFLGRRFRDYQGVLFNSGGAGYVLSRAALEAYVKHADDRRCTPDRTTPTEDVQIARCLEATIGLSAADTRDGTGRERFHPFAPGHMLTLRPPKPGEKRDWFYDYTKEWPPKDGAAGCAPDSVSFHYLKKPAMVRHVHALLYDCAR